jgi:hypothetical protein
MGFRNDTGKVLVIREIVSVSTGSRAGRPQKIFANETIRDTPPSGGGMRSFAIYDSSQPDTPIYTGRFAAPATNENVLYTIKFDVRGDVVIEPVKTPAAAPSRSKPPVKR